MFTNTLDWKFLQALFFSLMIAKFGVVFPKTSFAAVKLGGVFSNTVHYSMRAALYMV